MMQYEPHKAAITIGPDGDALKRSRHARDIACEQTDTGVYELTGINDLKIDGLVSEGWRTSIHRGDDGLPTVTPKFEDIDNGLRVKTFEPGTEDAKDIEVGLTLRLAVQVAVPEPETEED